MTSRYQALSEPLCPRIEINSLRSPRAEFTPRSGVACNGGRPPREAQRFTQMLNGATGRVWL